MSKKNGSASTKRIKGRHRGISYRVRKDGSRCYSVYWQGNFIKAGETEAEALAKQAELRRAAARGERVILPSKLKVAEVGKEHLADGETRLRPGWARDYRRAFERIIVPAWGNRPVSSITPHDVIALDQELRRSGKSESTVANYLKPARGMFDYALLQGYIPVNPFSQVPRPISHTNFRRRACQPAVEAAGLSDGPRVTPHDARHAAASELHERGLTSSDVAELLGHSTAGITERIYMHTFNREEREERIRRAMSATMASPSRRRR